MDNEGLLPVPGTWQKQRWDLHLGLCLIHTQRVLLHNRLPKHSRCWVLKGLIVNVLDQLLI